MVGEVLIHWDLRHILVWSLSSPEYSRGMPLSWTYSRLVGGGMIFLVRMRTILDTGMDVASCDMRWPALTVNSGCKLRYSFGEWLIWRRCFYGRDRRRSVEDYYFTWSRLVLKSSSFFLHKLSWSYIPSVHTFPLNIDTYAMPTTLGSFHGSRFKNTAANKYAMTYITGFGKTNSHRIRHVWPRIYNWIPAEFDKVMVYYTVWIICYFDKGWKRISRICLGGREAGQCIETTMPIWHHNRAETPSDSPQLEHLALCKLRNTIEQGPNETIQLGTKAAVKK